MQILVSGSLAYDRIMDFPEKFSDHIFPDKIHILNVCFLVNGIKEQFGGTAGNIAYNLALLGEKPLILASAGKDFDGYASWLERNDLNLQGIRLIPDEFTAGAYITTDVADNQITGFNPGAMKYPCSFKVDGQDPATTIAIIAPGNTEDMWNLSNEYKRKNIPYIFDPGQQIPVLPKDRLLEMIEGSKLLISNDYELEMIVRSTGRSKPELLETTEAIVTTLGDRGCLVATKKDETHIPAAKAAAVKDPTGAGDAFRAGLIKGLVMGKSLADAAALGSVCGSFGVECHGTQCHKFTLDDFWARHKENYA